MLWYDVLGHEAEMPYFFFFFGAKDLTFVNEGIRTATTEGLVGSIKMKDLSRIEFPFLGLTPCQGDTIFRMCAGKPEPAYSEVSAV